MMRQEAFPLDPVVKRLEAPFATTIKSMAEKRRSSSQTPFCVCEGTGGWVISFFLLKKGGNQWSAEMPAHLSC